MPAQLVLIGLAGAEWQLLHSLMDAGHLPYLQSIFERGVSGKLVAGAPDVAPARWATIGTGQWPDQHGLLSPVQFEAAAESGLRPSLRSDVQSPLLWDLAAEHGKRAYAVGWPTTFPAWSPRGATVVADVFALALGSDFDSWPVPGDAVSDPQLAQELAELRMHPTDVLAEDLLPFLPQAASIDQETDARLATLATALAKTATIHGAGTYIAEHHQPELLAVHFDLLEQVSHHFLQYHPPQMAHVTDTDYGLYAPAVEGAYRFVDLLVGRYLALMSESAHIMLVSDHGYLLNQLRPVGAVQRPGTAAAVWRPLGVFACAGPGLLKDELVAGTTAVDIAPTALHLMGLPLPADMAGKTLLRIMDQPQQLQPQQVLPSHGQPQQPTRVPGTPSWQPWMRQQLTEFTGLGWVAPMATNLDQLRDQLQIITAVNRAAVHRSQVDFEAALGAYDEAVALDPDNYSARLGIAQCHLAKADVPSAEAAVEDLLAAGHDNLMVELLQGQLAVLKGEVENAEAHLDAAKTGGLDDRMVLLQVARSQLQGQQWVEAAETFRKVLALDPDFSAAHRGLGYALYHQQDLDGAMEHFMLSLGLLYQQPEVHYSLGVVLAATGRLHQACEALRNALALSPDHAQAQTALRRCEQKIARRIAESAS